MSVSNKEKKKKLQTKWQKIEHKQKNYIHKGKYRMTETKKYRKTEWRKPERQKENKDRNTKRETDRKTDKREIKF